MLEQIQRNISAFLCQIYVNKRGTSAVASAPAVTGSAFKQRFRLFLGQCGGAHFTAWAVENWFSCVALTVAIVPMV